MRKYHAVVEKRADVMVDEFLNSAKQMRELTELVDDPHKLVCSCSPRSSSREASVIFEGAQGLGLDEDLGEFPHVTRSKTGLPNALEVAEELGISELDAWYVSRAYLTRHGAGPLEHEDSFTFQDNTNVSHEFQGSLRFAWLDVDKLNGRIMADLARASLLSKVKVTSNFALTCTDQVATSIPITISTPSSLVAEFSEPCVYRGGRLFHVPIENLYSYIIDSLDVEINQALYSIGPTSSDVKKLHRQELERRSKISTVAARPRNVWFYDTMVP
jgi:hypothetical protein